MHEDSCDTICICQNTRVTFSPLVFRNIRGQAADLLPRPCWHHVLSPQCAKHLSLEALMHRSAQDRLASPTVLIA